MDGTKLKFNEQQVQTAIRGIVAAIPGATLRLVDDRATGFDMPHGGTDAAPGARIEYDDYKHQFNISGRWPMSSIPKDNQMFHPNVSLHPVPPDTAISISATKGPILIAVEIQRRFWPEYFKVWAACNARRIAHEDFIAERAKLASQIAVATGQQVDLSDPGRQPVVDLPENLTTREQGINAAYGDFTVGHDTVQVNIRNLSAEKTLKLIEFLKTL